MVVIAPEVRPAAAAPADRQPVRDPLLGAGQAVGPESSPDPNYIISYYRLYDSIVYYYIIISQIIAYYISHVLSDTLASHCGADGLPQLPFVPRAGATCTGFKALQFSS